MQLNTSSPSPWASPTHVTAAARARSLLASVTSGSNASGRNLQPSPFQESDAAFVSPARHAGLLRFEQPLPATSVAASPSAAAAYPAIPPSPSQRALRLLSPQTRETSGKSNAASAGAADLAGVSPSAAAAYPAVPPSPSQRALRLLSSQTRETSGKNKEAAAAAELASAAAFSTSIPDSSALSFQVPVANANGPSINTSFSIEQEYMHPFESNSSSSSSSSTETATAALARRLQLSKSGDLWFGPQLQLALDGGSPSSTSLCLLLPWIISNCSRCITTVVATTAAAHVRTRPLDVHALAVMQSLLQLEARSSRTCFEPILEVDN
jgi:hypothetical protein